MRTNVNKTGYLAISSVRHHRVFFHGYSRSSFGYDLPYKEGHCSFYDVNCVYQRTLIKFCSLFQPNKT